MKHHLIGLTCLMLMISAKVFAVQCNEKSQAFIDEGDTYFNIDKASLLTASQSKHIQNIFKKFMKRVEGKKLFTECVIEDAKSIPQTKKYKIKGRMKSAFDGGYSLEFTEELLSRNFYHERLNTYFNPGQYVLIKNLTPNGFELTAKYKKVQGFRRTVHIEENTVFTVVDNALLINSVSYVNGYFGSETIIRIK